MGMIPRSPRASQPKPWRDALRDAPSDPETFAKTLDLPAASVSPDAARDFAFRVPPAFAARIEPGNPDDPLLRQVLPAPEEMSAHPGFGADPVGDLEARRAPGLLHKYRGRVLIVTTGACAIHCRYCFRRHFPYAAETASRVRWGPALAYVRSHPDVREVILSGGDPLLLPTARLAALGEALEAIDPVRTLRIHTRVPVVLPERVTEDLAAWLARLRLRRVVVVHVNHARELGPEAGDALRRLARAGATLLNQSVLLRGVNDDEDTLAELSETLFDHGVLPYYLHLLDPVAGAAHFEVDEARARGLAAGLRARLPGYLVPRLVRESRGEPYKMPVL